MGFGDSITKLLETYTDCIRLLKDFSKHNDEADGASSILCSSIRSDRSQVRRAYSSRLSERGRRLEKGDSQSRGLLRRTLVKLKEAMSRLLLRSSKTKQPALDYESLLRLSNSSRIDAVNAIDQLSQRLGSSRSRSSLSSAVSVGSRRRHHHHDDGRRLAGAKRDDTKASSGTAVSKRLSRDLNRHEQGRSNRSSVENHQRHSGVSVTTAMSMMSVSSDSTKLGEIPGKRRRLRRQTTISNDSDSSGRYPAHVRATYPLKPYPAPEPRSRLWGLFSRR